MSQERKTDSKTKEIGVPEEYIFRNLLRMGERHSQETIFDVVSAKESPLPIFTSNYYHANIGIDRTNKPELLELRFEKTDHGFYIALLMTDERFHRDMEAMCENIIRKVGDRGVNFNAVVAPATLGIPLAREIGRQLGSYTPIFTLEKGKPRINGEKPEIGSPKAWIPEDCGVEVSSVTSHEDVSQKLFLDPKIAAKVKELGLKVLLVDDARLTQGTISSSLELLDRLGISVVCVSTVLNESDLVDVIGPNSIPYEYLVKIPIFDGEIGKLTPREGSFEGVKEFYIEKNTNG